MPSQPEKPIVSPAEVDRWADRQGTPGQYPYPGSDEDASTLAPSRPSTTTLATDEMHRVVGSVKNHATNPATVAQPRNVLYGPDGRAVLGSKSMSATAIQAYILQNPGSNIR